MSDLRELYQDIVIDHSRNPRNTGTLDDANRTAEGFNPICGDRLTLYLKVEDDRIADVAFKGSGCAISTASASLMTESVRGESVEEAHRLFETFHRMITRGPEAAFESDELDELAALSGVAAYPARVKCATLAWHTLEAALKGEESISTE